MSSKIERKVACAALFWSVCCAQPTAASADVIEDWNATATSVLLANPTANTFVNIAMVHVAMFDAVNAIERRYSTYAITPVATTQGASSEAAAAAAAHSLLSALFPTQQALLDDQYKASLESVPDGWAETRGVAIGQEVSAGIIALRANDGRSAVVPYIFGSDPGDYQRTPPALGNPALPGQAYITPFTLQSPSQFRAPGPPDLTSALYALDFNTTKAWGASNSAVRTPTQTEIGRFHTEPPPTFLTRNLRNLIAAQNLALGESARLSAMVWVGVADAVIACWDSKYYYNRWRPVTAIPAADTDGNPATESDPSWLPLANTPAHPEYPAAHGCVTASVAEILRQFIGTKNVTFTFTSTVPNTIPHVYHSTDAFVKESLIARIYGGMHFPTSTRDGAELGKSVGKWVAKHYFRPLKKPGH